MLRQHFGSNMTGQFLASEFVLINFDLDTSRYNERKHYDLTHSLLGILPKNAF